MSALAIHHLDAARKQELFGRVAGLLATDSVFVFGDVIVPDDPADAVTPISAGFDRPACVGDLTAWLHTASLECEVVWTFRDLVVMKSSRSS